MENHSLCVGEMIVSRDFISPQILVKKVSDRFFQPGQLDAVAVVDCAEPVGLVTRHKFFLQVFRRFGFEIYGKRPVIALTDTDPLTVCEEEQLESVITKALARPAEDIYDEIIVVNGDGLYRGLLSVKQMIIEQSTLLANSIVQQELAHEKAKELEKINDLKSQFIAHVTHELRAPVNAIIGLAELMRISCEKGYMDQLKDRLSLLLTSGINLRAIITNILDLSKIEAGRMEVINEYFDIVKVLQDVAETTRILLGDKPVAVEVISCAGSLSLFSDAIKVRQILTNLASNAAKFTERGKIVLSLIDTGNQLKISVTDTGTGIRKEDIDKLFTAFSQLEDAHTKRYEGTGLGLVITKNLLDLLGGDIRLSSEFGKGTAFEITLPLRKDVA